jgi:hypothetical protein
LFIVLFGFQKNSDIKKYVQHISVMTISGVLMGLIRYLPTLKVQQSFPSDVGNQAGINLYNLNYLIFPYVGDSLPWQDLTLRSLYIGSVVLPLVFFFQRKTIFAFRWILIGTFSVFMMTFNSLNSVVREFLPLADVSRFAITDWRNTFNLSISKSSSNGFAIAIHLPIKIKGHINICSKYLLIVKSLYIFVRYY